MSNHHLRNTELSLKAKGLLSLMLSLPEDWDYTTKGLAHICKDGVDSITTALKELERHGYLTRQRLRYDNGQLGDIEYTIHEQPVSTENTGLSPKRENPRQVKPEQAKPKQAEPEQANPVQLNTNPSKTKKSKKDKSITYPYIGTYVIGKRKVKEIGSRHTQLKDESEWFKIPNHHPAIVSVDLFEKANASIKRFSLSNKKPRDYLLRGKVFCGCCDHAMSLRNGAWFYCRHSEVAETLPCHGVHIKMADLEQVVFETIRAQMCPALGIDSNKDKLDLQTVQQAEHEEKLRSIQDSKRHLYEQYALGEIDLETYRTRKAVYDTELVQAKNVHAVITAQTKQIKSDYEIKLKQQEIVQEVGNANMLTKALIDRLINKVYVFPGDRIEIEYTTQDFLETKESEKEV